MASEEGTWCLLNPLAIHFSQSRIYPTFQDARTVEESAGEIREKSMEVPGSVSIARPPYDRLLVPPFAPIRVMSWRPKLRASNGEPQRDVFGETLFGDRKWFALDNRRLCSLQIAAVRLWPQRCCAVVRCLDSVQGSAEREVRKFRTTTEGRSVDVGRVSETQALTSWNWKSALQLDESADAPDHEPPFNTELWDAFRWAPAAMSTAMALRSRERKKEGPKSKSANRKDADPSPAGNRTDAGPSTGARNSSSSSFALAKAKFSPDHMDKLQTFLRGLEDRSYTNSAVVTIEGVPQSTLSNGPSAGASGSTLHNGAPASDADSQVSKVCLQTPIVVDRDHRPSEDMVPPLPRMAIANQKPEPSMPHAELPWPEAIPCPGKGWEYLDPGGDPQGPFTLAEMQVWYRMGYFTDTLRMRCRPDDAYAPFCELFPSPLQPFQDAVLVRRSNSIGMSRGHCSAPANFAGATQPLMPV